jgi:hypothetical protein
MDVLIVIDHRDLGHRRFGQSRRFGAFLEASGIFLPLANAIGRGFFPERACQYQDRHDVRRCYEAHPNIPVPQGATGGALDPLLRIIPLTASRRKDTVECRSQQAGGLLTECLQTFASL